MGLSCRLEPPMLKGLFHPAFLARVVSWFPFVVAIFMGHENGGKQRLAKRRHVQGMLDETDPLKQLRIQVYGDISHEQKPQVSIRMFPQSKNQQTFHRESGVPQF